VSLIGGEITFLRVADISNAIHILNPEPQEMAVFITKNFMTARSLALKFQISGY
jgi:hypothetical protein